jgi:hypothetical protein
MIVARGNGPHLRDPNWYRVRYALAVQCIEIATLSAEASFASKKESRFRVRWGGDESQEEPGWPVDIQAKDGQWCKEFGEATADTLSELYKNRAPGQEHFEQAAKSARQEAEELAVSAADMLEETGWNWVGRKPPRFVRWKRALSPTRITRRRPVLDKELTLFLSWVVEPAAVVLLFSARLVEGSLSLSRVKEAIGPGPRSPEFFKPLDRRKREAGGEDWLIDYLARLVYDWPVDTRSARAQARLGRTQLRDPRQPSFRVQYNLACLFSRLMLAASKDGDRDGEDLFASFAAGQLEKALFRLPDEQRAHLAKWAKVDPGLATLRTECATEFEEIITRWGPGDKQEKLLEDAASISRVKYDPGSKILDVYLRDGPTRQYGNVPQSVFDSLDTAVPEGDEKDERKARLAIEKSFLEMIERDYPPLRP